jgi:hypothetical protein
VHSVWIEISKKKTKREREKAGDIKVDIFETNAIKFTNY